MLRAVKDRVAHDAYFTPDALALAICKTLQVSCAIEPSSIVEPSAGAGAFVRAARATWPHAYVAAVEPQRKLAHTLKRAGADKVVTGRWEDQVCGPTGCRADLCLGNPPYNLAQEHTEHALDILPAGAWLAFLVRLSLFGSAKRARSLWEREGFRYMIPVGQRPDFTGGGADNSEYMIAVWQQGYRGRAEVILPPLLWR